MCFPALMYSITLMVNHQIKSVKTFTTALLPDPYRVVFLLCN